MTYRKLLPLTAAALLAVGAAAGAARAQTGHDEAGDVAAMRQANLSLTQAIAVAEQSAGGSAIDAGPDFGHGHNAIAVAVATKNGVHTVLVSMTTGKVIATQPGGEQDDGPDESN